jgi:AAA family ATP:ADP antiporter
MVALIRHWLPCRDGEWAPALWSFGYFFCVLGGYYVVRPVRDTMGITGGVDKLQWLFTATFVVMALAVPLYGWLVSKVARRTLIPIAYGFFIMNLSVFALLLRQDVAEVWVARVFYVWVSVFNLFVVSVFWTFMADIYHTEQARRLFGFIAAGGSAGAIAGPLVTNRLAEAVGMANLLVVSAVMLGAALVAVIRLRGWTASRPASAADDETVIGGRALDGVRQLLSSRYLTGIGVFIVLYTLTSTFLYFQQASIVATAFSDDAARTEAFSLMDLATNTLTVALQLLATHRLVRYLGLPAALACVPLIVAGGFVALGLMPVFAVLLVFQVLRRAGNYGLTRPARETLFTTVSRSERYKAKNVIDTLVYRGGDAVAGWIYTGLGVLGLGLTGTAAVAVPVALGWAGFGYWLGRAGARRAAVAEAQA